MKYFLTGATGFLGGVLARQLREAGYEVNAAIRSPQKASELQSLGVQLFKGDVTDKESMRAAMQGTDGVFHVAGWYKIGTKDKSDGERVNVQGTRNVLELMKELHIPKGVYTSTVAINSDTHGDLKNESYRFTGKHLSEYDRTKAVAHEIARQFIAAGLPLVIVMPGGIYGPGDTSVLRATLINYLQGKLPMLPTRAGITWAHVEDVAHGHILAMKKGVPGETYILAGEPGTYQDAFQIASHITGKPAPSFVSYRLFKVLSMLVRPFDAFLPETYTSEGLRIVAGPTYYADNSKAKRFLGYNPRPLSEGLESTLKHEMSLLGM
ncbi:MAG TPA: NAD-dependent epimerase/dehydratase family protein [Anaerolineales bacterium]|nr:NAD-dependent epimerase/dehydratase family protein [Anaerolineales bacterium]